MISFTFKTMYKLPSIHIPTHTYTRYHSNSNSHTNINQIQVHIPDTIHIPSFNRVSDWNGIVEIMMILRTKRRCRNSTSLQDVRAHFSRIFIFNPSHPLLCVLNTRIYILVGTSFLFNHKESVVLQQFSLSLSLSLSL